ncbi:hypothetical protein N788_11670 [Arenimonas donghaensis DSM 18148 = HO3-R19]|uniref:SMP-30/Gluconolactonase/LRE-like region domain-containing protein n=2 Tax=Arenimonas TaxID=490567 RepID=A0A087MJK7_9GAMM|nr:hypothetical protein N788_11670 [Arenimonas donghaensis DSM 18148 = HO3-R19]
MAALLLGASQVAAQPYAYLPNSNSNNVSVVDDATQAVVATIPVGSQPWGVSVSPDSSLVYIGNRGGSVSAIDTSTNTVVATIGVVGDAIGVTFSPDGSVAYVVDFSGNVVRAIDTATHSVVNSVAVGSNPYGLVTTPDGSKLYVSNYSGNSITVIDTGTFTVTGSIPAGSGPLQLAMSPDGTRLVVANGFNEELLIVDTATDTVTGTVGFSWRASGVAISNDGTMAVVTSDSFTSLVIVDLVTLTVDSTIAMGTQTWGVDFTPDGSQFYVSMVNSDAVRIFDTATLAVSNTVAVGSTPFAHGNFFATGAASIAQGVQLDANPAAPVVYAQEIIASPGSPVTLLNPAGDLNLSANLGYSFSIGEVRYARFECDNGLRFAAGSAATYDGSGSAGLGAINGLGGSAMHFSITANDNNVTASDRLVITGDRQITGTNGVNCTYSLYDFPSQAAAGGAAGRVYTVSGPYIRFAPSYALEVDAEGNPIANVESTDPAYSEFTNAAPTFDVLLGRIGAFSYGEVQDVTGAVQPLTPAGPAITLAGLMHADTALVFAGDFSAAADVFFSPLADCSVNIQSADDFSDLEAVFTIGSNDALAHHLCFEAGGVPMLASEYTVMLDAVSATPALYAVADRGPLDLGEITRNGTELQAPLAQIPAGWLSRMVLTNTGSKDREYEIVVMGETGNTISTDNLAGTVKAGSTLVVELDDVLTGFTGLPRATLNVTVAAPNRTIQGLYQIVNPDSGSISNHVMVRPGTN